MSIHEVPTLATIQARPYPLTFEPASMAVIVVDMTQGFGGPGGWWDAAGVDIRGIQAVVPALRRTLDVARGNAIPVIFLYMDLEGVEAVVDDRLTHYYRSTGSNLPPLASALPPGVRQSDFLPELSPQPPDITIEKPRWSGFFNTDLDSRLREMGATTLVFTGATTSVCVDSTLRDACFRDYDCLLLEDCCAEPIGQAFARTNHDDTVYQVETTMGWVSNSSEFAAALTATRA